LISSLSGSNFVLTWCKSLSENLAIISFSLTLPHLVPLMCLLNWRISLFDRCSIDLIGSTFVFMDHIYSIHLICSALFFCLFDLLVRSISNFVLGWCMCFIDLISSAFVLTSCVSHRSNLCHFCNCLTHLSTPFDMFHLCTCLFDRCDKSHFCACSTHVFN
jgi:hypothetical protein